MFSSLSTVRVFIISVFIMVEFIFLRISEALSIFFLEYLFFFVFSMIEIELHKDFVTFSFLSFLSSSEDICFSVLLQRDGDREGEREGERKRERERQREIL